MVCLDARKPYCQHQILFEMAYLPPEVLDKVSEYCDNATLSQLRLASHPCATQASRHLFRTVHLHNLRQSFKDFQLLSMSRLATHVRQIIYTVEVLPPVDFREWSYWSDRYPRLPFIRYPIDQFKYDGHRSYSQYRRDQWLDPCASKATLSTALPLFPNLSIMHISRGPSY